MADIVVQDNQVTTVVEASDGNIVVATTGGTDVVSTEAVTTIVTTATGVEIVETSGDIIVAPQETVTVVEVNTGGSAGISAYPWNVFRNSISSGEVCVVPAGSFLLGVESFLVEGILDNEGKVLVL